MDREFQLGPKCDDAKINLKNLCCSNFVPNFLSPLIGWVKFFPGGFVASLGAVSKISMFSAFIFPSSLFFPTYDYYPFHTSE